MRSLLKAALFGSLVLLVPILSAQTCYENIKASTPDSRFKIQGGEAFDVTTQLTWKRCSVGQQWDTDIAACTGLAMTYTWSKALGLADDVWRLPNVKELYSLTEVACANPMINLTVFPDTPAADFWTSSPDTGNDRYVWIVSFLSQGFNWANKMDSRAHVRLVRDGE